MNGAQSLAYHRERTPIRHHERALLIQIGPWAGADIRPTRIFLWPGHGRRAARWILSVGRPPRLVSRTHRRHLQVRSVRFSFLGNPVLTLLLLATECMRTLARPLVGRAR